MRRDLRFAGILSIFSLLAFCRLAAGQNNYLYATGNPSFGVNIPIENGYINVANGNVHIELPLAQHPQRGNLKLDEGLVYDSRIWQIVQGSGYSWQPVNVPNSMDGWRFVSGLETGSLAVVGCYGECNYWQCPDGTPEQDGEWGYTWTDPAGTAHTFDTYWFESTDLTCDQYDQPEPETVQGYATDSSGYSVQMTGMSDDVPSSIEILDADGNQVYPAVEDRFGNQWTSDGNGNLVDDLGRTPVTVTASGSQIYYSVLSYGGGQATYTVTTEPLSVSTGFGQSAVSEFSGTLTAIQSLQLPDGSSYSFAYDSYGEMTGVTLPSGGTVSLGYSNYQDSYQDENRWLTSYSGGHGSLAFTPSVVTQCSGPQEVGCQEQMTVTDAAGNDTLYLLTLNNGAWNVTKDSFSGPMGGGHMLVSTATGYNLSNTCTSGICTNAAYVTKQSDTTSLVDVGLQKQTLYNYNPQLGKVTSVQQTDYYSGSPAGLLMDMEYTYTGYDLTQAQVLDGSSSQVALTNYNFTGTATATSGIVGHGAANPDGLSAPYLGSVAQWAGSAGTLTTTFTNDDTGAQLTSTGPNGQTSFGHDSTDAYITGVTPPTPSSGVSLSQSAAYDPSTGLLTRATDPNGATTSYSSYDWAGRPAQINYPDGGTETFTNYSAVDRGDSRTINGGASTQTRTLRDGYGRLSRVAVFNGQTVPWYQTDYCYDINGRLQFESYRYQGNGWDTPQVCSGAGDTYSYDALGRITQVLHGDGTSVNYQHAGRATEIIDENGVSRISQVDALGRTTAVCEISSNSSMPGSGSPANCGLDLPGTGFLTTYAYSLANHQTTVSQGAQTRTFQTDPLGRTISVQEPESGITAYSYAYNGTGLVVTRSRPQANQTSASVLTTTTTQYDAVGRVGSIDYNDGLTPNKNYYYDAAANSSWTTASNATNLKGRLAWMTSGSGATATGALFSYDAMGRVANMWECAPSICGTTSQASRPALGFSYDWAGNLTGEFDGASGPISYTRSPAGEVTSITNGTYSIEGASIPGSYPLVSTVQNGPFGPVSYDLANGVGVTDTYDALGRWNGNYVCSGTTSIDCVGANAYLYGFWVARQGEQITEECDGFCATLGYDEFNRLTSFNPTVNGQQSFSYAYDKYGNRWTQSAPQGGPSFSASFNAQNNQMVGYGYDAAGNMTNDGSHSYQYDAEGNLLSVDSGSTAIYVYDAMNRRVSQQASGTTNEFMYDYAGRRTSTWIASINFGSEGRIYWDGKQIAFRSFNSFTYFDHQDWRGTERLRTDYTGADAAILAIYPFGDESQSIQSTGPDQDSSGYASMEYDAETNTDHAQYRQYSSAAGRWMSPDPYAGSYDMNDPQSFNRYSYVANNPLTFNDPSGQDGGGIACAAGPIACIGGLVVGGIIDWLIADDIFGGGPSFHGSLKTRPSTPDPGSLGESLGIPTSIPQGNWGLGMALNLPSEACDFGPCGGGLGFGPNQGGAATNPYIVAYSISGIFVPFFGLGPAATFSYVPSQHLFCGGGGIGASAGHNFSFGSVIVPSTKARQILGGGSVSFGANITLINGAQTSINSSGSTGGYSIGVPGLSGTATYSGCISIGR